MSADAALHPLYDQLTGLANRTFFAGQLDHALAAAERADRAVTVLVIDVDRFDAVNQAVGHSAGDDVLRLVGDRLRALVRAGDVVARLEGNAFALACPGMTEVRDVASLARRIGDAFAEPFVAGDRALELETSVGVAQGGAGGNAGELLAEAERATHRAKAAGGARYEMFDADLRTQVAERVALEAALREAVERDELLLHYQPLVDLETGAPEGFEALLRWNHPVLGLVGAESFVGLAVETDLILPIGHSVLRAACAQLAAWNARWPQRPPIHVRINVAPRQITPALAAAVGTAVRQEGVAPSQLCLEVTERLLVDDARARDCLQEVRDLGVSVALDDFGTGYSSLSHLARYPIDVLKLDRGLVAGLGTSPAATAIVKAAVDMAAALGLRVVGEGVERAEQAQALRELGCAVGQGFLFSRPLTVEQADALLAERARVAQPA